MRGDDGQLRSPAASATATEVRPPGVGAPEADGAVPGGWRRWWIYQAERFPLVQHGPLVLVFSASAVCYANLLAGRHDFPGIAPLAVAFFTCLIFFLQLRIADEFKDFEDDSRWRPYRPVPRGLVRLPELAWLFALGAVLQLVLALLLDFRLVVLLGIAWLYLAGMSKEFFARDWLKRRPVLYMTSHMFIMPLVDLYATGCGWLVGGGGAPAGLAWFLVASYFNGMVIEIGRKVRAEVDEEEGVETYSALWGRRGAVASWWVVLGLTLAFAAVAAWRAGIPAVMAAPATVVALALWQGLHFLGRSTAGAGKSIETWSGIWVLVLYLSLGIIPMTWEAWRIHP